MEEVGRENMQIDERPITPPYRWMFLTVGVVLGLFALPLWIISLASIISGLRFNGKVDPFDIAWLTGSSIALFLVLTGVIGYMYTKPWSRHILDIALAVFYAVAAIAAGWVAGKIVHFATLPSTAIQSDQLRPLFQVDFVFFHFTLFTIMAMLMLIAWLLRRLLWRPETLAAFHQAEDVQGHSRRVVFQRMLLTGLILFLITLIGVALFAH